MSAKKTFFKRALILCLSFLPTVLCQKSWAQANESQCSYETWDWDTIQKRSVNKRKITKPRSQLDAEERGPTEGCTVCVEDQIEVVVPGVPPFTMCRRFSEKVRQALIKTQASGFPIKSLVGYRVGKSKGPLNSRGERTQFSNHSYGTAVDINSEQNGLYDFCFEFKPGSNSSCKLIRGGAYLPTAVGAITKNSSLYQNMIDLGFKWGGEINGKQKDFMHFSLTGM